MSIITVFINYLPFSLGYKFLEKLDCQYSLVSISIPVNAGTTAIECHWDRSLFTGAKSGAKSQSPFKATKVFKEVYIGHTATRSHLPENYGNLWNLDSGCGWHGKLTVMDIDTKEYWQSNFSKNLYPNEKGR